MKPDWNSPDCPEWAQYLAKVQSGEWFWYEVEPKRHETFWGQSLTHKCKIAALDEPYGTWDTSLEKRPERNPDDQKS